MNRLGAQGVKVQRDIQNAILLLRWETPGKVSLEFVNQDWDSLIASTSMAHWVFAGDLCQLGFVIQAHREGVRDRSLVWVVIIARECAILNTSNLLAQRIDSRIRGDGVLIVSRSQATKKQRDRDHVLNAMVSIGGVAQGSLFVDDAQASLMRPNRDGMDIGG
jgi:hypothetical protein